MFKSIRIHCFTYPSMAVGDKLMARAPFVHVGTLAVQRVRAQANATPDIDHAAFMTMTKDDLALTRATDAESLEPSSSQ